MAEQNITSMLRAWGDGRSEVLESLMPLVFDELHKQAARCMRRERAGHTLQTTALINETYLKLIDQTRVDWQNRAQFFAIAANLMRRILVDHARSRAAAKRGDDRLLLTLEGNADAIPAVSENNIDLLALDEALERLAKLDDRQARVVELRYFSGLTLEETAAVLNISRSTAAEDWALAKAWLRRELTR